MQQPHNTLDTRLHQYIDQNMNIIFWYLQKKFSLRFLGSIWLILVVFCFSVQIFLHSGALLQEYLNILLLGASIVSFGLGFFSKFWSTMQDALCMANVKEQTIVTGYLLWIQIPFFLVYCAAFPFWAIQILIGGVGIFDVVHLFCVLFLRGLYCSLLSILVHCVHKGCLGIFTCFCILIDWIYIAMNLTFVMDNIAGIAEYRFLVYDVVLYNVIVWGFLSRWRAI